MTHKKFFFKILNILEKNKIEYCLFAGTLLGAVRDKDFLPGDTKDTDIALDDKYYWQVRYLLDKHILKGSFKWYSILRKEISVADNENKFKVDMFFMESNNENYFVYSYKPNPINKKWDYEWRAIFPKHSFFPTKKIKFLNRLVHIPNDYNKILTTEYGDWRVPDPSWVSSDDKVYNTDLNYKGFYPAGINVNDYKIDLSTYNIGFVCVNFLRPESTKKCILYLKKYFPNVKVYLADQSEPSGEMIKFYEDNNVEYYFLPFDWGLSNCRNFLIDKIKEPYIMWGDNDFVFDEGANLDKAIDILEKDDIGFVGGAVKQANTICHYERILSYIKPYKLLIYIPLELTNPEPNFLKDIPYYYCDLTFNFVICKSETLQNNTLLRWNPGLKVSYEHTDMFLRIKEFCQKRVVYCPALVVIHEHESGGEYDRFRLRKNAGKIFAESWDLKMNFTIGQGKEVYFPISVVKERNFQLKPGLPNNLPEKTLQPEPSTIESVLGILLNNNINFCLIKDSCLEGVTSHKLSQLPIKIGVEKEEIKEKIKTILNVSDYNMLDIIVFCYRQYKTMDILGLKLNVPFPVISYLERLYNKKWKDLNV